MPDFGAFQSNISNAANANPPSFGMPLLNLNIVSPEPCSQFISINLTNKMLLHQIQSEQKTYNQIKICHSSLRNKQETCPMIVVQIPMALQRNTECAMFAGFASSIFRNETENVRRFAVHIALNIQQIVSDENHEWSNGALLAYDAFASVLNDVNKATEYMNNADQYFQSAGNQGDDIADQWKYIQNNDSADIERVVDSSVIVLEYPSNLMANFEDGDLVCCEPLVKLYQALTNSPTSAILITNTCRVGKHWRGFYILNVFSKFIVLTTDSIRNSDTAQTLAICRDLFDLTISGYGMFRCEALKNFICSNITIIRRCIENITPTSNAFESRISSQLNQILNVQQSASWKSQANAVGFDENGYNALRSSIMSRLELDSEQLSLANGQHGIGGRNSLTLPTNILFNAYTTLPNVNKSTFLNIILKDVQTSIAKVNEQEMKEVESNLFDGDSVIMDFVNNGIRFIMNMTADKLLSFDDEMNQTIQQFRISIGSIKRLIKEYSYNAGWQELTR